jgi:hypothetical protein
LLKASLPVREGAAAGQGFKTVSEGLSKQPRPARRAALRRVNRSRATSQWVVLTSWDESGVARMVLTVAHQEDFVSYAAVPTAGGWLVFQL